MKDNYGAIYNPPTGAAPHKGDDLQGQPPVSARPDIDARSTVPDAVHKAVQLFYTLEVLKEK